MDTTGKASPTLTIGVSVLVFVGYLQLTGGVDYLMGRMSDAPKVPTGESAQVIDITDLVGDYADNTVRADAKYKGKRLAMTAMASRISTDMLNRPYLTLRSGLIVRKHVTANMDPGESGSVARLRSGQTVRVLCTGAGDFGKAPVLNDCRLI